MLKLPIEKPTAVTMFFLAVALFGVISFQRLPQELFPSLEYPQITIITKYEGAGPEEAEKLISKIIEETVGTAKNIRRVTSISKEGTAIVICEFYWGTDINFAALEVREKIDLIKERLPKDSQEPVVVKYNPFQLEAMSLSVSYKKPQDDPWKLAELRMLCKKQLKDELERLDGVAKVDLYGGTEKEVLVEIDKNRLLANQISLLDVIKVLKETNITYPAGTIKEETQEFSVKTIGEFKTIDEISRLIIPVERKQEQNKYKRYKKIKEKVEKNIVYLSDLSVVKESIKDIKGYSRYNKKSHVSVSIYPQSKANLIKISEQVREKLDELIKTKIPTDVEVKIVYDQSEFIKSSLNNVYSSAIQGGVLTFIIVFLFLKDFVASVIIIIAVPLAMLATFILMYFGGISLNTMSLGGLAIGVGMVVDNSIIVLEKIFTEKERFPEKEKKEVIYSTITHIVGDIVASTATTIAIFLPLVFVSGVMGQLFKELALTISFSLVASVFVALFLVPRLALWLDLEKHSKTMATALQKDKIKNIMDKFPNLLRSAMKLPIKKVYFIVGAYLFLCIVAFYFLPKEFLPKMDQRKFILNITLPPGTILKKTNDAVCQIEDFILSMKDVKDVIVNVGSVGEEKSGQVETLGPNQARVICQLSNSGKKTSELVTILDRKIKSSFSTKIEAEFITEQGLFGSGVGASGGLVAEVKGKDLDKIKKYADEIANFMEKIKEVYGLKITPSEATPELKLEIQRDKVSLFGLSVQDISTTILSGIKGYVPTKFKQDEDEFDIRVRFQPKDRTELSRVGELTVYSSMLSKHIRLDQLTTPNLIKSPPEIRRAEGQRMYIVSANVKKRFNKVVKQLNSFIEKILDKDRDVSINIVGEVLALRESSSSAGFALILGIVIIYMILASQFESLLQPLIVMITVPLGLMGAILTLFLTANTLNSISAQGFIMLIGIVVDGAALLISGYNSRRAEFPEKDLVEIVEEVTSEEVRTIFLVDGTTIIGLIPLAFGIGVGQNANSSLAIAIIGGLIFSVFLTLFFIPIIYLKTHGGKSKKYSELTS
ncbi:MAG: efflux RND transporter permease subunit [Elusimicrobiota bacterium]